MKIYILLDAEGISGVVNHEMQVRPDSPRYPETRKLIMADLNAAIAGAVEAGATDIVVYDMHYYGTNVSLEELHPRAKAVLGKPAKIAPPAGIGPDVAALFMIGYHSMAETPGALLAHTYTLDMKSLRLNGVLMGEIGLEAAIAGSRGVPLALLSGDDAALKEAAALLGELEGACVKQGTGSRSALCLPLPASGALIRQKAAAAVKTLSRRKPYRVQPPYEIEIEFYAEPSAEKAAGLEGVARQGRKSVRLKGTELAPLWEEFLGRYTAE